MQKLHAILSCDFCFYSHSFHVHLSRLILLFIILLPFSSVRHRIRYLFAFYICSVFHIVILFILCNSFIDAVMRVLVTMSNIVTPALSKLTLPNNRQPHALNKINEEQKRKKKNEFQNVNLIIKATSNNAFDMIVNDSTQMKPRGNEKKIEKN